MENLYFMRALHSKAQECSYTDAPKQIHEQFTVMIADTKCKMSYLQSLVTLVTPEDALKITHKIEA